LKPYLLLGLDTETTGIDIKTCEVVQLGAVIMTPDTFDKNIFYNCMAFPDSGEIPESASDVHGIYIRDVLSSPCDDIVCQNFSASVKILQQKFTVIAVTYNGESYDMPLLARYGFGEGLLHIDVYRIVQRMQGMWQHGLKLSEVHEGYLGRKLGNAHDAISDVVGCLRILEKFMTESHMDLQGILNWLSTPLELEVCHFGKHKGVRYEGVPTGYLAYIRKNWDYINPDLLKTINRYLR
jgi:DNA polymerase III epsilon subunit-like protein